jgi:ABC-type nitrate/sulfonate/bicarbonate transport system permease component
MPRIEAQTTTARSGLDHTFQLRTKDGMLTAADSDRDLASLASPRRGGAGHPFGRQSWPHWREEAARRLEPLGVVVSVLTLWEILSRTSVLPREALPPATEVGAALYDDIVAAEIWLSIWQSVSAWMLGLAVVVFTAIPTGILLGRSRLAYRATHLVIEFVRPIPTVAALPLLILVYGIGAKLAVILVVLTAFWPLLIQTMYGTRDIDPVARDTVRVYGLSRRRQLTMVILPSVLPYIATGMRLSAVLALLMAIGASLVAGGDGLGAAIANAESGGQVSLMYARIVMAGVLGLAVTALVSIIDRKLLHWHHSRRVVQR